MLPITRGYAPILSPREGEARMVGNRVSGSSQAWGSPHWEMRSVAQHCGASFQRVVFASRGAEPLTPLFDGFGTRYIDLAKTNVFNALMASGAIPYVFEGVYDIDGAGKGAFWDGGIIDYHFDLKRLPEDEVWLYPHFSSRTTVGWFDKFLPWRADRQVSADQLIMICPSDAFLAQLPFGKIPDRRDFGKIPERVRETYWRHCVNESQRLADEFHELINGPDPLAGATSVLVDTKPR